MDNRVKPRKKVNVENISPKEVVIEKLGEKIRKARKKQGFTSAEHFAYELEISRSMYGKYEAGNDLRFSTLVKIIEGMGLTVSEFFKDSDKKKDLGKP